MNLCPCRAAKRFPTCSSFQISIYASLHARFNLFLCWWLESLMIAVGLVHLYLSYKDIIGIPPQHKVLSFESWRCGQYLPPLFIAPPPLCCHTPCNSSVPLRNKPPTLKASVTSWICSCDMELLTHHCFRTQLSGDAHPQPHTNRRCNLTKIWQTLMQEPQSRCNYLFIDLASKGKCPAKSIST